MAEVTENICDKYHTKTGDEKANREGAVMYKGTILPQRASAHSSVCEPE